jgi:hypothetical protein
MDKKNVQNRKVKIVLTDRIFSDDVEKLSSQIKRQNFILLLYFFLKNLKGFLSSSSIEDAG